MSVTPAQHPVSSPACDLCGLALPSSPVEGKEGRSYCCHGCAHVDEILQNVGAGSERGRKALEAAKARGLIAGGVREEREDLIPETVREEKRFRIDQLACPSCAWLVEAVLEGQEGVARAEVDYYSDTARVVFDLSKTSSESLTDAVKDAGYSASVLEEERSPHERKDIMRLAVAFFLAMNQMMFAWVGYGIIYKDAAWDMWRPLVPWIQLLMAVPVVLWCALPLYRRAIAALKRGRVVMETLLSLGIISATAISVVSFIIGEERLFFESASMLVALSLAGRWLENWIKWKTSGSLTDLLTFAPSKARGPDGHFQPLDKFAPGSTVLVDCGETVPLDLRTENDVVVREGLLTGESHPVQRFAGAVILAGSVVEKGQLRGRVERPAAESAAEKLRARVMEALRSADEGSRMADRIAQGFVPLVILVALGAFVWHMLGSSGVAFAAMTAVSVLVVSCPCAFGVAASSALSLAVLRLVKRGILVKDPSAMERAAGLDTIVFDKTGTLTRGELNLEHIGWVHGEKPEVLTAIRGIEAHSEHPIGITLARLIEAKDVEDEGVVEIAGMGITGEVNGRRFAAGKASLFAPLQRPVPSAPENVSRVWFGLAGEEPSGWFDISDTLRAEAGEVIAGLKQGGIRTMLLSGDDDSTTKAVGASVGILESQGGLMPEDKSARVDGLRRAGRQTGFVGDGFNDAEALASADIGFAMAAGADLAMISAPVVFTRNDLRGISHFLSTARKALSVLRGNFAWAFLYNIAMIPIAAAGLLAPVYAALLMALSSASVGLNSLRLRNA